MLLNTFAKIDCCLVDLNSLLVALIDFINLKLFLK